MKSVITLFLVLITSKIVASDCPIDNIHGIGHCAYRIQCTKTIQNISLDNDCLGSSNYDVRIDIILHNASSTLHIGADAEFLPLITTLTVYANWPKTDLSFLNSMYRLRQLRIVNSNIEYISDSPFRNLINLENIDLSRNKISDIGELFQFDMRPFNMKSISLAFNSIVEVPGDAFVELTSLVELDLSYNLIEELNEEPFSNLTNLEVLKLNNNKIKDLNGALNNLFNLKHLYLRFNNIQKIDKESIKITKHLETLDVSKNKVENINPLMLIRHWKHFSNFSICRITLSENYITHLPNITSKVFEIFTINDHDSKLIIYTKMDLSKNSITHIEYNAFNIINMVSLDLSNNKLTDFIVNANDLMYVKYLNLSSNYLSRLYYESFSSMYNLQNLDLSYNYMDDFPDQPLSNSHQIKSINVTYNDISELHNLRITFHPEGGILDLSNNGLSILTIPTNDAVRLRELVLNSNNISDAYLIKLSDQPDLTRLDMSKNFIQKLDETSLQLPAALAYLDLSYNEIYKISPSSFHRLKHMKTLRLSHNRLTFVEYGVFRELGSLVNLDLSFNELKQLDSKVFLDLNSLSVLSLRYNGLHIFTLEGWFSKESDVMVYLEGNNLSCEWLAKALTDYTRGYSKMHPTVLESSIVGPSIQGIPCQHEVENLEISSSKYMSDERLLIISQKILEAVQEQTSYLRKYIWRSILQDAERKTKRHIPKTV